MCKIWLNEMESFRCTKCLLELDYLKFEPFRSYITTRRNEKKLTYPSKSSYDDIRTLLSRFVWYTGVKILEGIKKKQYMGGIKIMVTREMRDARDSLEQGKMLRQERSTEICVRYFIKAWDDEYIFVYAFLTIVWNLMTRSDNFVHSHINHFRWDADFLQLIFPMSKWN